MKQYERVIPRDFFNEAKLLKCMGMLSLKILDCMLPEGVGITIEEYSEQEYSGFEIRLSDDGNLYVHNYETYINERRVWFGTTYNSKMAHPFYLLYENVEYLVFDEDGNFTQEFIEIAKTITNN